MKKQRRTGILICILTGLLLAGILGGYVYIKRSGVRVESTIECVPDSAVYFCQKDNRWKDDPLGDSEYHMGDSGCLTSCLAAEILMQEMEIEGLEGELTPGTLNQFFSENQVYDSEGNLQWDVLENVIHTEIEGKEAAALRDGELESLLADGCYPIVCVKMPESGNYHFVLLIGSENGTYWCMDPLNQSESPVALSEFGDRIFSVRYIRD
ncbi:MAG: hypothetical protein IJ496_02545 [Ruminococcus sp.]|nr:hypothetical protein [Ruminococcus sp.]